MRFILSAVSLCTLAVCILQLSMEMVFWLTAATLLKGRLKSSLTKL
jgi:hypothetical protein